MALTLLELAVTQFLNTDLGSGQWKKKAHLKYTLLQINFLREYNMGQMKKMLFFDATKDENIIKVDYNTFLRKRKI